MNHIEEYKMEMLTIRKEIQDITDDIEMLQDRLTEISQSRKIDLDKKIEESTTIIKTLDSLVRMKESLISRRLELYRTISNLERWS